MNAPTMKAVKTVYYFKLNIAKEIKKISHKNNVRSSRFSDELAELINRQVRKTFTEKFENLVTRCVWKLPQ